MRKYILGLAGMVLILGVLFSIHSCGRISPFIGQVSTTLTSSSLSSAGIHAAAVNANGSWEATPSSVSGLALSILFPINAQVDEGVVVFGDGRPDIAPAQSDLSAFSLDSSTTFSSTINKKPGFVGGTSSKILMLFGYFDVSFTHNSITREVRMVYGDTGDYVRGDKLLKIGGEWMWYDTGAATFSATRPSSPAVVPFIRDFSDPIRPVMHYYFLGANLNPSLSFTNDLLDNYNLSITVDFDVTNSIIFPAVGSLSAFNSLSDADLITKFDMIQNVSDWSDPGITCNVSMIQTAK